MNRCHCRRAPRSCRSGVALLTVMRPADKSRGVSPTDGGRGQEITVESRLCRWWDRTRFSPPYGDNGGGTRARSVPPSIWRMLLLAAFCSRGQRALVAGRRRNQTWAPLAEARRQADTRPVRQLLATLLAAAVSTAIFVILRNRFDLEDSRFITALLAFSTVALALSVASSISLRSPLRSTVALGVAAFLLVPLLYVVYLVLFVVSVCIVGGQTCYS
jgi:hypothetical protein